jgi:hypothetical protein
LLNVPDSTVINFLPTVFNQLFRLLTRAPNDDIAMTAVE